MNTSISIGLFSGIGGPPLLTLYERPVDPPEVEGVPVNRQHFVADDADGQQQYGPQADADTEGAHPHAVMTRHTANKQYCIENLWY